MESYLRDNSPTSTLKIPLKILTFDPKIRTTHSLTSPKHLSMHSTYSLSVSSGLVRCLCSELSKMNAQEREAFSNKLLSMYGNIMKQHYDFDNLCGSATRVAR